MKTLCYVRGGLSMNIPLHLVVVYCVQAPEPIFYFRVSGHTERHSLRREDYYNVLAHYESETKYLQVTI